MNRGIEGWVLVRLRPRLAFLLGHSENRRGETKMAGWACVRERETRMGHREQRASREMGSRKQSWATERKREAGYSGLIRERENFL